MFNILHLTLIGYETNKVLHLEDKGRNMFWQLEQLDLAVESKT